jgi:hypothetical protein
LAPGQVRPSAPGPKKDGELLPGITIDNIYSGMTLGTSFTVVGSYYPDGMVPPAITCVLDSSTNGTVDYENQRWQADFSGVGGATDAP